MRTVDRELLLKITEVLQELASDPPTPEDNTILKLANSFDIDPDDLTLFLLDRCDTLLTSSEMLRLALQRPGIVPSVFWMDGFTHGLLLHDLREKDE